MRKIALLTACALFATASPALAHDAHKTVAGIGKTIDTSLSVSVTACDLTKETLTVTGLDYWGGGSYEAVPHELQVGVSQLYTNGQRTVYVKMIKHKGCTGTFLVD